MPRAGLDAGVVLVRAAQLLDQNPAEALTLGTVAESLGVRTPSLYKHVDGLPGLNRGVMMQARRGLTRAMGRVAVGRSREDAITSLSRAYRRWALEHPGQYPLTVRAPAPGDEEDQLIADELLEVLFGVMAGYELHGDDAVDATRFLRAALHGFVALETGGGYEMPVDLERSFDRLVESVVTALSTWAR